MKRLLALLLLSLPLHAGIKVNVLETNKTDTHTTVTLDIVYTPTPVPIPVPVPPPVPVPTPVSGIQGFAKTVNTTGGLGGNVIVVTNCNGDSSAGSLRAAIAVNAARIIGFKPGLTCTINWTNGVTYVDAPNMTIDGAGAHITISGMSLSIHKTNETATSNVIIRNLTFANGFADRNAINVDKGTSRVWIDHNTFYNNSVGNTGQGVYISDNTGSTTPTYTTVSWNHFKAPNIKSTVIGQINSKVTSGVRTSYHHNWFDGVDARNPKVAGEGVFIHFWNNFISNWGEYASAVNDGANFWAENNYYEKGAKSSNLAIVPDYGVPSTGPTAAYWWAKSVKSSGNMFVPPTLSARTVGAYPATTINYTYTAEPANAALKAAIQAGSGAK
jgi:pectate lyase